MSEREDVLRARDDLPRYASGDQDYDSATGWDNGPDIEKLVRESKKKDPRAWAKPPKMLEIHPASEWVDLAQYFDPSGHMFGPFWRRGEVTILFGGTGTGKSALAAQIAESLARGRAIAPFDAADAVPVEQQRVLYVDFELRANQFAMRYARIGADAVPIGPYYEFSAELIRCELAWDGQVTEGYDGFSDMFFTALVNAIANQDARAVIIDNITFLDRTSTSNANTAMYIMRALQQLKRNEDVSILVLAHTPKRRAWMPVTELDLQGSINLANFADSIFAVARSRVSPELRYLKQVKVRSGSPERLVPVFALEQYDLHSAMRCGPEHPTGDDARNFLGFKFVEYAEESEHLEVDESAAGKSRRPKHDKRTIREARRLYAEGKSTAFISRKLVIPKTTVFRYVRKR
ncbi:MAG: AAA family ATPase [Acidobacteriota bacterium]